MDPRSDDRTLTPDDALDRLGRIRLTEHSMRSLLEEIAVMATNNLPGRVESSVTLLTGDDAVTAVYTGSMSLELDKRQYGLGSGPCLHAAAHGEPVEIVDTRSDPRWPDFVKAAAQRGCGSSLSLPLPLHEGVSGALDMYAREPAAFDERIRGFVRRFASYGAVVAGNMLVYESALDRAKNLEAALVPGRLDQAKGILMERFKLTPDQPFRALARVSMETNRKVRDVAERFVATGEWNQAERFPGDGHVRTRS